MSVLTRPVLRWHGGKWRLAPKIIQFFPEHRVYTEAYAGAASVLMRKKRAYAEVYNDLQGEVVNLFRVLRDEKMALKLKEQLELTPFAREEFMGAYEDSEDPIESARRFVILSFMGFGSDSVKKTIHSSFRANSNRSGTTPAHDWANYPQGLTAITGRLKGVIIESRPAIAVIQQHDSEETLHYLDPPYVHSTRKRTGNTGHGYTHEMKDEDHLALLEVIKGLKGMVILSGYASNLYEKALEGWNTVEIKAMADGARERIETLWFNESAWARKPQSLLI